MKGFLNGSLVVAAAVLVAGCGRHDAELAHALTGGDAKKGELAIEYYGCASCHEIPGVPGADGMVGPSLAKIAKRSYIGGVLNNNPSNLIQWIKNPPMVDDKTAMPNVGVSDADARNIATYLYTLR